MYEAEAFQDNTEGYPVNFWRNISVATKSVLMQR